MVMVGFVLLLLPRERLVFDYSGEDPLIVNVVPITWLPTCGTALIVIGILIVQLALVYLLVWKLGGCGHHAPVCESTRQE